MLFFLAMVPNELIFEVIESIPVEWQVSLEEREGLINFLVEQKSNIPTLMESFIIRYSGNMSSKKAKKFKEKRKY